jgi:hypothetical protein
MVRGLARRGSALRSVALRGAERVAASPRLRVLRLMWETSPGAAGHDGPVHRGRRGLAHPGPGSPGPDGGPHTGRGDARARLGGRAFPADHPGHRHGRVRAVAAAQPDRGPDLGAYLGGDVYRHAAAPGPGGVRAGRRGAPGGFGSPRPALLGQRRAVHVRARRRAHGPGQRSRGPAQRVLRLRGAGHVPLVHRPAVLRRLVAAAAAAAAAAGRAGPAGQARHAGTSAQLVLPGLLLPPHVPSTPG